jgi:hypothetical protein
MTDTYDQSSAQRTLALDASLKLDRDRANAEQLRLGRDLAQACLKRAAENRVKVAPMRKKAASPNHAQKALLEAHVAQVAKERARVKARQLIVEGLRLIPPEERRGFFDLAVRWLEHFDRRPEPSA